MNMYYHIVKYQSININIVKYQSKDLDETETMPN